MTRDELIKLARDLLDCKLSEDEGDRAMGTLQRETGDPLISDYMYWADPGLSAEDAVDKALGLRDVPFNRFEP